MSDAAYNYHVREAHTLLNSEILAARGGGDGLAEPNLRIVEAHITRMQQQFNHIHQRLQETQTQLEAENQYGYLLNDELTGVKKERDELAQQLESCNENLSDVILNIETSERS